MIRIILIAIFLFLFLLLGNVLLAALWLLGKWKKPWADLISLRIVQIAFQWILFVAGVEVTVIGEENIPDEPVLFIGNHRSYFDILVTYSRCRRLCGYVAKKEMLRYPFLRVWMKRLYCLFLDRDNIREGMKTILEAIEYMNRGISICIFPEGTRNTGEEGSLLPFHAGSFKIAEKSGCAIIPMSLCNTVEIFEAHLPKVRPTHVVLEYGKPIYPKNLSKEERKNLPSYFENLIRETIKKNQSLV